MKVFGLALLCVVAAVQSRSFGVEPSAGTPAALGENPWVVHLSVASSFADGLLRTCAGSLVHSSWVLTSASCVRDSRFIWVRYGNVNPITPEFVSETNTVRINPDYDPATGANDIALISLNRVMEETANIRRINVSASGAELPSSAKFCGYSAADSETPGEQLSCFEVTLTESEDGTIIATSEGNAASKFDIGAPLVSDDYQVGLLVRAEDGNAGVFINPSKYSDWIQEVTGASF